MATISGQFVDANTNKGLSGVVMDIYPTGDMSGSPATSFQSNDDGTFTFTSSYLDTPGSSIEVQYPGYGDTVGDAQFFNGRIELYPSTPITNIVKTIPWWAWALVILVAGFLIFKHGKKYFK